MFPTEPDTFKIFCDDPRIGGFVRLQMASDWVVSAEIFRMRAGVENFNRDAPYETEILSREFDGSTGISGGAVPKEHIEWFHTVANNYLLELTQPNGTQLNDMTIVENETPTWRLENIHYVFLETADSPNKLHPQTHTVEKRITFQDINFIF